MAKLRVQQCDAVRHDNWTDHGYPSGNLHG